MIGAVAWLGGSIFFALILRPIASHVEEVQNVMPLIGRRFQELADVTVLSLVVSGIILMVSRISTQDATTAWFIVLGVKLTIAAWMFITVWRFRGKSTEDLYQGIFGRISRSLGYNVIPTLGVIVFLLASLLRLLIEKSV